MSIGINTQGASALDNYQMDQGRFAKGGELGKNEFLELLVAQLNNQDPLSPQENGEFIAQLAQFSTVEGIEKMGAGLDNLARSFQSSQALQASSMVGRSVIVPTSKAMVDTEAGIKGDYVLPASSANVLISVYDESGALVHQASQSNVQAGTRAFSWDGRDGSGDLLPPGMYSFKVEASFEGGNRQLNTLLPANVDSVSLPSATGGEMLLNLAGIGSMALSSVQMIGK